jgi:uncharacterized protein (DUF1499 family)
VNLFRRRLVRALTRNVAETSPDADDPRLVGRTYAVPFEDVWQAAVALAIGLPGWTLLVSDDREGRIVAEARTRFFRFVDNVSLHIRLDENGQTRVDARSVSRTGRADYGTNARRIGDFFRRLDERLAGRAPRPPLYGRAARRNRQKSAPVMASPRARTDRDVGGAPPD